MLSNLFAAFGWTRDDWKWTWTILVAVLIGLAASVTDPTTAAYYGVPETFLPFIRLGALLVGIMAGAMKTSNLPGQ